MKHFTKYLTAMALMLTGCDMLAPDEAADRDVAGTYTGHTVHGSAPNADAVLDTTAYTLRIEDSDGFIHGVWIIEGDTLQPTDPWEAVITGDYTDGRMVLEYHSPTVGQCHLAGDVASDSYVAEHRCAEDWSTVDTLRLVKLVVCPAGSPVWMDLQVCAEPVREGYDRDAFGTGYRSLEDEIVASLPQVRDSVFTPYTCALYAIEEDGTAATDIEHIVALSEAYDSGLHPDLFRDFAKDLDNLTIADPTVNRHQKSDKDAGEWSPTHNRGWFASRVVAVKQKYRMAIDPPERDSLALMLAADTSRVVTCGG